MCYGKDTLVELSPTLDIYIYAQIDVRVKGSPPPLAMPLDTNRDDIDSQGLG